MFKPIYDELGYIIGFEEVIDNPIEYRLYYDENGRVLYYTMDKPEGNYVVIDKQTYQEARPDARVVDGKVAIVSSHLTVCKLMPNDNEGTLCAADDISIVLSGNEKVKSQKWKLVMYELQ